MVEGLGWVCQRCAWRKEKGWTQLMSERNRGYIELLWYSTDWGGAGRHPFCVYSVFKSASNRRDEGVFVLNNQHRTH